MSYCHLWQPSQHAHFNISLHSTYSQNPFLGAPFAASSLATCWRGGLIDWPTHGRGKESKVVQNMRYVSAMMLTRRVVAVMHSEGVGAGIGEVLGVA
jgi:hypothetical protein